MNADNSYRNQRIRRSRDAAEWVTIRVRRKLLGVVQGLLVVGVSASYFALCMLQLRVSLGG